jgi:hypothetical protein
MRFNASPFQVLKILTADSQIKIQIGIIICEFAVNFFFILTVVWPFTVKFKILVLVNSGL